MRLETEVNAPHDGTVLAICVETNTSVSSGRVLALVGVAGGTRVVALSDEEVANLDRDQVAVRLCARDSDVGKCRVFPEARVKSYATSWCCCFVIDVCGVSSWRDC